MRYLTLALKNMTRNKRRTVLLAGGIAFGLMSAVLVGAVASGIVDNFLNNQAALFSGHLAVQSMEKNAQNKLVSHFTRSDPIRDLAEKTFGSEIKSVALRTGSLATLINGAESRQQLVQGIDFDREEDIRKLVVLEAGSYDNMKDPLGIILAHEIAADLQVKTGDRVLTKIKTIDGQNNAGEFTVAGIVSEKMGTLSTMAAFVHRETLNGLLTLQPGEYTELDVFFKDGYKAEANTVAFHKLLEDRKIPVLGRPSDMKARDELKRKLAKELTVGGRYIVSSIDENFSFVSVISGFIDASGFIMIAVVLGIIMIGIMNSLRMTIYERTREIGTLRALGMQRRAVLGTFLFETMLTSFLGIFLGLTLAGLLALLISAIPIEGGHSFIALFLHNDHMTLRLDALRMIVLSLIILVATLLAALLPSSKAARIDPAKAITTIT